MASQPPSAPAADAGLAGFDKHGIWLLVRGSEYFLPYEQFPWFRDASVRDVLHVGLLHEQHLHWPALDVDLSLESLRTPEAFPLTYE